MSENARQIVHLSGILFIILAQFMSREAGIFLFGSITLFFLAYSWYVRTQEKKMQSLLGKMESRFRDFTLMFERKGVNPFSGAFFMYLGFTAAFVAFPPETASAACAMLAVGDSLSTLAGRKFGRHKIGSKTIEGTLACFAGSLAIGVFFTVPHIAVIGAAVAAFAELVPKIDDNLAIPIASGMAMFLAALI